MDDSQTRRKKPSLHNEFDEATAILAAVSLLTRGFALLSENSDELGVDSGTTSEAVGCLSRTVGVAGMAAGQMTDLLMPTTADLETMELVNGHKTSLLFVASAIIPAILSGAEQADIEALGGYAHNIGLAYQIIDDVLDYPGPSRVTLEGVPAKGNDGAQASEQSDDVDKQSPSGSLGANNIASVISVPKALQRAEAFISSAVTFLKRFGERAEHLRQLAQFMLSQNDLP